MSKFARLLVFDTSTPVAIIGLLSHGQLFEARLEGTRHHSQQILALIDGLLEQAGIKLADCDVIGFGVGPGSFTGLRIGACLAQGFAYPHQTSVVAIPTLSAIAETAFQEEGISKVWVVQDARMSQVYHAPYIYQDDHMQSQQAVEVSAPSSLEVTEGYTLVGSGVDVYYDHWSSRGLVTIGGVLAPSAKALLAVAQQQPLITAAEAHPLYVRQNFC